MIHGAAQGDNKNWSWWYRVTTRYSAGSKPRPSNIWIISKARNLKFFHFKIACFLTVKKYDAPFDSSVKKYVEGNLLNRFELELVNQMIIKIFQAPNSKIQYEIPVEIQVSIWKRLFLLILHQFWTLKEEIWKFCILSEHGKIWLVLHKTCIIIRIDQRTNRKYSNWCSDENCFECTLHTLDSKISKRGA